MDWFGFSQEWREVAEARGFDSEVLLEVDGIPIWASRKGDPSLPCLYLSSGIHGDEPSGPQALLELLKEDFFGEGYHWLVCPNLNPSGLGAGTRENREGIDLNRDYHFCNSPEVCAHVAWLERQTVPRLFLSLHEDWESTGFYYYEINLGVGGPTHEDILEAASVFFSVEPGPIIDDHEVTEPGWIYHSEHPDLPEGWPEAIYLARRGCPLSLTFETPSAGSIERRIACHRAVVREAILKLVAGE